MTHSALLTSVLGAGLLLSACTSGQASQGATLSNGAQVVQVTPAIKAEIRRQGQDPDEEICKREKQMGTNIPARICATRAMWAAKSEASQQYTADIQRDALRTRAPGDGG